MGKNEAVPQLCIEFKNGYDSYRRLVLHNILIALVILMKLESLKKMLNEIFRTVQEDKHLSGTFTIKNVLKQGHILSPLLLIFLLEYATKRVQVKQNGWKLNGTNQLLVYADFVNILDGREPTIQKNAISLVAASKEFGREVNANKTRYVVMCRNQSAGRSHGMKIDNSSYRSVYHSKHL